MAAVKEWDAEPLAERYSRLFMETLAVPATTNKHVNVLEHMSGYLRDVLDADARREVRNAIEDYRSGYVPLVVPITLLRHYVRLRHVSYLQGQRYLEPHPKELMIRNHV